MCIICNAPDPYGDKAMQAHHVAGNRMKASGDAFLVLAEHADKPEQAKRYKQVAYKMKRLTREWNKLEEEREI